MKAIGLHQPWAWLIRSGQKTIETRFWSTDYRGPVLICSTKVFDHNWPVMLQSDVTPLSDDVVQDVGTMQCIVDIVDCRVALNEDEEGACCPLEAINPKTGKLERKHAILLSNPHPVKRNPVKCGRKWFEVPDDQVELIDPTTFPQRSPLESLPLDELAFVRTPTKKEIEEVLEMGARDRDEYFKSTQYQLSYPIKVHLNTRST